MADPEIDWEALPVEQLLTHKLWKARCKAYETLAGQFQLADGEDDAVFREWNRDSEWPRRAITDSNAVAQEKGVVLVSLYAKSGGRPAARCRADCMPPLAEKCLATNARKGTRDAAMECVLGWTETEADSDKGEGVVTPLIEALGAKQPKVVAGSVAALNAVVAAFGARAINPKPILKALVKIFGHADKAVRAEGTTLVQTLYTFLGPALEPSLAELKPVQVKELQESFAAMDTEGRGKGTGKPTRETASQKRERLQREAQEALEKHAPAAAEVGGDNEPEEKEAAPEVEEGMDPYDFADPVAVKLPPDFYEKLASSKWKERKEEALDPLNETLASAIKIKPDHYDELVKALAGRMTDANILCVVGAANALEKLAKGLRGDFARYKGYMVAPMLEKFKEKKTNVVDALSNSLDAMAAAVSISDLTEDLVAFSKHKNPSVKEQTMRFLVRCLRNTTSPVPKSDVKPISDLLLAGLDDAVVPVRDAAAEGLGTMMKLVGRATFESTIQGLDEIKKGRVIEYFEKAEIKYRPTKAGGGGAKPKAPAPMASKPMARAPSKPKPVVEKENEPVAPSSPVPKPVAKPVAKPPARLMAKKPTTPAPAAAPAPVKKPVVAAPPAKAAPAAAPAAKPAEPVKYKMSQEDAEARAPEVFPDNFGDEIGNSVWKTRLAAMDAFLEWLPAKAGDIEAEVVVRFLNKKPGPKESNFQVWQRVFSVYQLLAEQTPSFSKACMALSIPACSEKYGDAKLKEGAGGAMSLYAEKSSLGFVLTHAFEPMSKQKAVKMLAENYVWVENALREFGIAGVPVRDLIEFIKSGLKSVNPAVRTNATKCLVTTKLCIGADISNFLQDLNPQLLSTIEGEFNKIADEKPPAPTRSQADLAAPAAATGGAKGKSKATTAADDALDELIPRVDLDKLLTSSLIKSCDDTAWKVRKESLEQIQGILEANKRLKPALGNDITKALKQRLTDPNKVVQGLALDILARIATGMGKPFERFCTPFLAGVIGVLSDKNAGARNNALAVLTATADACGVDCLVGSIATGIEAPKPELRSSALGWLGERLNDPDAAASTGLSPLAGPIIPCLEDRNPEVRKAAQALLPSIVASAGFATLMDHASTLKPASRGTIVSMIEAARNAAPAVAAAPKAAPRAAPTAAPKPAAAQPPAAAAAPAKATLGRAAGGATKSLRPATSSASLSRATTPHDDNVAKLKPGLRRPGAASGSRPSSSVPTPTPTATDAPFKSSDPRAKLARAAKETGPLRWIIEGAPRKDQIEQLHVQMGPCVSSELLGQLFSRDHHAERDFLAGLGVIEGWAMDPAAAAERFEVAESEVRGRLIANLDLIFKYITIRLYDTNTSITMKCLDLVEQLFAVLQTESYHLSDYEASALLPSLIAKSGDSKEAIRARIRTIYKSACTIYPFSKVFQSLLDHGLKSKNARVRAESAEELSALFQRQGLAVCQPAKALPVIASLIGDRDASVRNGALSALASAYASAGDVIHRYVGSLPGKEQDMLNERLKRTDAPPSPRPGSSASNSRPESRTGVRPSPPRLAGQTNKFTPARGLRQPSGVPAVAAKANSGSASPIQGSPAAAPPPRAGVGRGLPQPSTTRLPHRREASGSDLAQVQAEPPSAPESTAPVSEILSSDEGRSIEALKAVQAEISQSPSNLVSSADALVDAISTQMNIAFEGLSATTPQSTLRLCKHLMQTLSLFFDRSQLATAVTKHSLVRLLAQLTQRLQETANNPSSEGITSLSKVLNMVLIRIFHNSERSACFGALFQVLQMTTIDIRTIVDENELSHRAKYAELVMKCLWKVSKTVKESLEDGSLDTRVLLKDIDDFLIAIPPAEWRRRANDNVPLADMPLRTVKTILQQVVSTYGETVYDMLSLIDNPDQAFVYQYLFRLLNNSQTAAPSEAPSRPNSTMRRLPSSPAPPVDAPKPATPVQSNGHEVPSPRPNEVDLNNHLTDVFAKIGNPTDSKKGIAELYELLKAPPEAKGKVDKWVSATGQFFQAYLKRALANLKAEDEQREGQEEAAASPATPPQAKLAAKVANSPSAVNGDGRTRTTSREQDLSRLQSLFGFSGQNGGEA